MTEYSIDFTCLCHALVRIGKQAIHPACVLHDFSETHCLVYTRYSKCEVLHHRPHHSIRVRCLSMSSTTASYKQQTYTVQPFPGSHSSDRSPSRTNCQSHSLWLHLSKTFDQMHLTDYAPGLWTTMTCSESRMR
jgi:hypothetical protein